MLFWGPLPELHRIAALRASATDEDPLSPNKTQVPPGQGSDAPGAESPLRAVAEKLRPAMVFLAVPGGSQGSGFVISKKHRLVATAAHATNLFSKGGKLLAFRDGTSWAYTVEGAGITRECAAS